MSSVRETFILKIIKYDESEQCKVAVSLRNIKSEKSLVFNSTGELARYLDESENDTPPELLE